MSKQIGMMKHLAKLGLILMMGGSLNANAGLFGLFGGSEKWKEEVQLSDGRIVVVERETIHKGGGDEWASNRSGSMPKERRLRFAVTAGSTQMIEWRSTKFDFQTWPEKPLVLDVVAGQPVVYSLVAISSGCEVYSKYVYRNGVWIEEPLLEQFEQLSTNLFIRDGVDMPSFVNLATKREGNSDSGYRRALKQVGPKVKVCG